MYTMKANKYYLVISVPLFVLLMSCKEETLCPEIVEAGQFELLSSSKELFPYKDSIVHIIYRDSLHNEVSATAFKSLQGLSHAFTNRPCLHQPQLNIRVTAQTEFLERFLSIPALDIGFRVGFRTVVNFQDYESDQVRDGAYIIFVDSAEYVFPSVLPPQIALTVDQRNYPEAIYTPISPVENFSISGKPFTDVYTNTTGADQITFHYNHEFGIIGFKLQPDGNYWVFDRFE